MAHNNYACEAFFFSKTKHDLALVSIIQLRTDDYSKGLFGSECSKLFRALKTLWHFRTVLRSKV